MKGKRAQVSLDLLIGFSVMLFILIFSFIFLKPFVASPEDEATKLCSELASIVNLVSAGGDKFHTKIELPTDLGGEDYNVTFVNSTNVIIIEVKGREISCETITGKVIGWEAKPLSTVSISNLNDYIYITSSYTEKRYYSEVELDQQNLTIRGYGFKPNTWLNLSIYDSSNKIVVNLSVNADSSGAFMISVNASNLSRGPYTGKALYSINENTSFSSSCNPPVGNPVCGCAVSGANIQCSSSSDCVNISGSCSIANPPCPEVRNAFVESNSCSTSVIITSNNCICSSYCQGGTCAASCSNSGSCNYRCYPGYYDCNNDISDGCESDWPCNNSLIPSKDELLLFSSFRFFIE